MAVNLKMVQRLRFTLGAIPNLWKRTNAPEPLLIWRLFWHNLRTHRFEAQFNLSTHYELINGSSLSLRDFPVRFPRSYGYRSLSSIAFSNDGATALFYTEHHCSLCGIGEYVVMRREQGQWFVANQYGTWVS